MNDSQYLYEYMEKNGIDDLMNWASEYFYNIKDYGDPDCADHSYDNFKECAGTGRHDEIYDLDAEGVRLMIEDYLEDQKEGDTYQWHVTH